MMISVVHKFQKWFTACILTFYKFKGVRLNFHQMFREFQITQAWETESKGCG